MSGSRGWADSDHRRDRTGYHGGDQLHRAVRRLRSPTEVLQVERPRLVRTRFGSWLLRGVEQAMFEDQSDGTLDPGAGWPTSRWWWGGSGRSGRTGAASGGELSPSFG